MSKFDRELQRNILHELYNAYPRQTRVDKNSSQIFSHPNFVANVVYLNQHGLVDTDGLIDTYKNDEVIITSLKITAQGIDFYESDGGISAILKTVIIKPDVNAFLELLRLQAHTLPPPEKENLIRALATFSSPVIQGIFQSTLLKILGMS